MTLSDDDLDKLRRQVETDHHARTGDPLPHERFVREIKGMLVGDEYLYAEDTLRGILATVQRTHQVSDRQRQAIQNIQDHPHRGTSRGRERSGW